MAMALEGIRVIDLTRLAPGPFCTMILGDFGADVIRVEEPGGGRLARETSGIRDDSDDRRRAAFNALNRNKRSIALNLKSPDAQTVLRSLCARADVFVEGFRPGVVSNLGCDYFTWPDGRPMLPDSLSHAFLKLARKAGVEVRLHDMRHTHASLMLREGVSPKVVQERLGHSNFSITMDTYSHVMPGLQEAAAERFDKALAMAIPAEGDVDHSAALPLTNG